MALPQVSAEFTLVADPELKFLPSGTAAARLRMVANKRAKDDSGDWYDKESLFITGDAYGELAQHVAESLVKADLVVVTGELLTREWDSGGQKKSIITMRITAVGPSLRFRTTPHGGKAALEAAQEAGVMEVGSQYQREAPKPPSEQPAPDSGTSGGYPPGPDTPPPF